MLLARLAERARRHPHLVLWGVASLLGAAVFFLWLDYGRMLDPSNLHWMGHDDPFTHNIGWEQFRNAPLLQYPITKNTLYGLELGSNIVFSDSIPIVALVLRPFSALLPHPFVYLGWWMLLSCVLQAYWSMRLVLLRSDRLRDAVVGSIFFLTTPVWLERLGGQTAVGSHWILLCALWLYLNGRGAQLRTWAALLLLTLAVHAYLFAMVGPLWLAHLVACRLRGELGRRELIGAGVTMVGVVAWMHALGYFMIGGGAAGGAWRSNCDLLAFLEPALGSRQRWLPVIYNDPWDGCMYLGGGAIVLLVASAVAWAWRRRRAPTATPAPRARVPWLPLVVAVLALAAFAITDDVKVLDHRIVHLPYPHVLLDGLYRAFRGAARMMWPAYYLVMLSTVWLALRAWPGRAAIVALSAAAALQLYDVSAEVDIKQIEANLGYLAEPPHDPIWNVVGSRYQNIVSVPSQNRQDRWWTIAWFAAQHGMGSNVAYLSRIDPQVQADARHAHVVALATGKLDRDTVYIVPSRLLWNVARSAMGRDDLAVVADGLQLILPGGRRWATPPQPAEEPPWTDRWIRFTDANTNGLLFAGWSWADTWGTLAIAPHATLVLPAPSNQAVRVSFKWFSGACAKDCKLHVKLDDRTFNVDLPDENRGTTSRFEAHTTKPVIEVELDGPDIDLSPGIKRPAVLGLIGARVQLASAPLQDDPPVIAPVLDTWTSFATNGAGRAFLQDGWLWAETWGTWSAEPEATLAVPVPAGEPLTVTFRWKAAAPRGVRQHGHLYLDEHMFDVTFPPNDGIEERTFEITSTRRWVAARFVIDHPFPSGTYQLGVGLEAVRVSRR